MMNSFNTHILPAIKAIVLTAGLLLAAPQLSADNATMNDSIRNATRESLFPEKSRSLAKSHFTWGAEAGASIDLTGHDMSTFDVDVLFGYKNSYIRMVGLGAGIHRTVQRGDNFIPIYATIQTSFRKKPSLVFMSAKIGYSFNTISDSPTFGDFVSSIGVGVNLSLSRLANSYIILSAGSRYFNKRHIDMIHRLDQHYIYIAQLRFGVSF